MAVSKVLALVALLALAFEASASDHKVKFTVKMDGRLNGVRTKATGTVKAVADTDGGGKLSGTINLKNFKNPVTQIHFHIGPAGVNGPVLAWIWPLDTKNAGTFTVSKQPFVTKDWTVAFNIPLTDIVFSTTSTPPVADISDLLKAIKKGNIYVNVHTTKFPEGEIRGQTKASGHS